MSETDSKDFIMLPKVDLVFKELMANSEVRKSFLSAVLKIDTTEIKETIIENTNLRVMHSDEKFGILDVRVLMNNNKEIDIEIQLSYYKTWPERTAFYLAKMLTEQTNINKTYSNIKKCICISILDFKLTQDKRFYKSYHIREDQTNELFTDIMEWHIIEMKKLPEQEDGTALYNWTKFIKSENKEEMKMLAEKDKGINEAYKQLEIISQDKQKQIEYTSRMKSIMDYNTIMEERYNDGFEAGEQRGRQEGITIGEQRGRQEGRQETLSELAKLGINIPDEVLKKLM